MELTVYKVYNRPVHSYLAVFCTKATGAEDANVFVCKDDPTASSSSALETGSSSTEDSARPFTVYPKRVLVTVASLTDLLVYTEEAEPGELYRAATVAMIFRSEDQMDKVVRRVIEDVGVNARLQRSPLGPVAPVEFTDPVWGKDGRSPFIV
jgi:hypothetical protein